MADTLTLESMAASSPGSIRVGDDNNGTRKRSVASARPAANARDSQSVILSAAARHKITLALLSRRDNHRQSRDRNLSS